MQGLYDYYKQQTVLPTFADFRSEGELAAYAAMRVALVRDRLALPPAMFRGADVLEFGPDSGENALVFASWGARLTLVEPNERAHDVIRAYFDRFGLASSIRGLHAADVLGYRDDERYDFVDAEGFIFTVKPTRAWLDAFRRLLRDDGMFLITYYERFGAFFELSLRALQQMLRRRSGLDAEAAAGRLYAAKWDSIPHTRTFRSWVMDVLENPYVRRATFLDAAEFVGEALAAGFDLYATHPHYDDVLAVDWHKRVVPPVERAARSRAHIDRSVLSFLAGRTLYIGELERARAIRSHADALVGGVDRLIDADDDATARAVAAGLEALAETVREPGIAAEESDRTAASATFAAFAKAFRLALEPGDALAAHTSSDEHFIAAWGIPAHVAVGRALPA